MVKLYGFCLSIAYIARWRQSYIESLLTLWLVSFPDPWYGHTHTHTHTHERTLSLHLFTLQLQTNVKTMQGWGFVNLPLLLHHHYLVCILFGMPSLHPFTFFLMFFLNICANSATGEVSVAPHSSNRQEDNWNYNWMQVEAGAIVGSVQHGVED